MRRPLLSFVPLVLIGLCIRSSLIGAEEKAEKEESARRLAEMKKTVERVELTIGKAGSDKLTRVEEPIQRWSHPLVRIVDATVFLWTRDGRPSVVAQVAEVTGEGVWQESSISPDSLIRPSATFSQGEKGLIAALSLVC